MGNKKENRRYEHKSERQATRQAIRTGRLRAPRSLSWSGDGGEKNVPLIVDRMPHRSSKKGCKRNKGGVHDPEYRSNPVPRTISTWDPEKGWVHEPNPNWNFSGWRKTGYFCKRCNKRLWNYARKVSEGKVPALGSVNPVDDLTRPYPERDDHMSYSNIWKRLAGEPCCCTECR
jgi:hypothetical protein